MTPPLHPSIHKARKLARLLDSAVEIPFIKKRVGLDPLLGLLPGGGDFVAMVLSGYILWVAIELRLPPVLVGRMAVNLLADFCFGSVPVVGDLADLFFKANQMNLTLLEKGYAETLRNQPPPEFIDIDAEPA